MIRFSLGSARRIAIKQILSWQGIVRINRNTSFDIPDKAKFLSHGLHSRKARGSLYQSKSSKKAGYNGPRSMVVRQWMIRKRFFFSAESIFNVNNHAGNCCVKRYQYEKYSRQCILTTIKHPIISGMFWGSITSKGVGRLSICSGMMLISKNI